MSNPWMKFYPSDWRADPALRVCSIGARGLWMEVLCLMHEATPRGSLLVNGKPVSDRMLANLCGLPARDCLALISEMEEAGVFSRDPDGTIFSRRIRRDEERSKKDKANGSDGGNPEIRRGTVPKEARSRRYRRSDSPAKTRRIFDRTGGQCHWCEVPLRFEWDGVGDMPANLFHVDHVVAICDGGTNDEDNLVAACAACNHRRAREGVRVGSIPDQPSDPKAQSPESRFQIGERDARASGVSVGDDRFRIASEILRSKGLSLEDAESNAVLHQVQCWLNEGMRADFLIATGVRLTAMTPNFSLPYLIKAMRTEWRKACEQPVIRPEMQHAKPAESQSVTAALRGLAAEFESEGEARALRIDSDGIVPKGHLQ